MAKLARFVPAFNPGTDRAEFDASWLAASAANVIDPGYFVAPTFKPLALPKPANLVKQSKPVPVPVPVVVVDEAAIRAVQTALQIQPTRSQAEINLIELRSLFDAHEQLKAQQREQLKAQQREQARLEALVQAGLRAEEEEFMLIMLVAAWKQRHPRKFV